MTDRSSEMKNSQLEGSIAAEAHGLVHGDRAKSYGHPRYDFAIIAKVWSGLLADKLKPGEELDPYRVAILMSALKLCRLVKTPTHHDSRVDTIGYMLTMERLDEEEQHAVRNPLTGKPLEPEDLIASLGVEPPVVESLMRYVFPYLPNGANMQEHKQKVIMAKSYTEAKALFEAWDHERQMQEQNDRQVVYNPKDVKLMESYAAAASDEPEDEVWEHDPLRTANPTDNDVELAQEILARRAAFHDREAQQLFNSGQSNVHPSQVDPLWEDGY